ncbi:MAG: transglycosylase SLT domain-containing protein [Candidatus Eremiobacteraeota bacterium]|nr:transglycosylase SLT domain-containing protein [Candidatus Eremiobacteraeota bacterium]
MSLDPIASRLTSAGVGFAPEIADAARRHGLDPELLAAVAAQETGGPASNSGANIVGDGGHGHGLFQIDDRWHAFAATPDAMDPEKNADYAAGMLSGLLARYGGNVREALSAYNAGSPTATGTRTRWSDGSDLSYADSVMRHYQLLSGGAQPRADTGESAERSAVAESRATIASVGALRAQAQLLPMQPPQVASLPRHHAYQRLATNYVQLFNDASDEKDS